MTFTVIVDPGYRMGPSFSGEGNLWNLTEHQTFFPANEQRRCPGAASAEYRAELRWSEGMLMRLTLSVIKADVGSVGGHTKPSARMMATFAGEGAKGGDKGLLIDVFVRHTGDDIAIVMTHTRGEGSSEVH